MSTISSGIGLVSGLPIQDLVDALIEAQRQPITLLQNRLATLVSRRTALLQISAQILAIKNSATRFDDADFFRSAKAASTDEAVILATASAGAAVGQYTFTVRNLAISHQVLSAGFATSDTTAVGPGTLTLETAAGRLDRSTELSSLNGGSGVRAGRIRITDRANNTAQIDLTAATTIGDVVSAINAQTDAAVTARAEGDHLVLEDQTGLSVGNLTVAEVGSGTAAADLGILGLDASGTLTGADLVALSNDTRLDDLNDGNGVRRLAAQADFSVSLADGTVLEIDLSGRLSEDTPLTVLNHGAGVPSGQIRLTNKTGSVVDVDLSSAATIGDVKDAIEASGLNLTVTLSDAHLLIADNSTGSGQTSVEDIGNGGTAEALGLVKSSSTGTLTGDDIYFVDRLGDVLNVINDHADNAGKLIASISSTGTGLTLTDTTGGGGTFAVTALNGSQSADDLGLLGGATGNEITSRRLLAGLDTVLLRSLNGGGGVTPGVIQLTDRAGTSATVDLGTLGAETLAHVIAAINAAATSITASVSDSGLGIELRDDSGGTGNLVISGSAAADLQIIVDDARSSVSSGNLQRQYISATTRMADLNNGDGIPRGQFRITDSSGASAVVDLSQGDEVTLQDVIDEINSRGIGVTARINDSGDGLLLEDTAGGTGSLAVAEEGSTTAQALGILGTAAEGETTLDGSLETQITVSANDTLEDVLAKIQASGAAVSASIINDGSSSRPFRLNISSTLSGRSGRLALSVGTTGLSFDTLAEGRDATVLFGPADADAPIILTSATNTLAGVIPGVRLDLIGPSDTAVTISVTQDVDAIVAEMTSFVSAFNSVISSIDDLTRFDPETETRSILTGDATARRVRSRLLGLVNRDVTGVSSAFDRLTDVGITLSSGTSLSFDETKFRQAFDENRAAVVELFTHEVTGEDGQTSGAGLGAIIQDEIDHLTDADTGIIPIQEDAIRDTEDVINNRIDQLETLLDRRRERLLAQFFAAESAIAQLQTQQSALSALSANLSIFGSGG